MNEVFVCITDAYRCFLRGSVLSRTVADVATVIFNGVCGRVPAEDTACAPAEDNSSELTCISLTLVDMMTCLVSQSQPAHLSQYCVDILRVLFQDLDLMTQLVHQFLSDDQIISHLAAKVGSSYVVYCLLRSETVCQVWQQQCVEAFHRSAPGAELNACLWSLTEVLKKLLKAAHQETIGKLVAAFDSSLIVLSSNFFHEGVGSRHWGITFCLLLDLLETLTASMSICEVGLKSQRLAHTHSSALLAAISCSPDYFVKKRILLLLKRVILQKAGDDWVSEVLPTMHKHEHHCSNMSFLAHNVLTAVAAGWLDKVQVKSASFFGGTRLIRDNEGQKPDCVMLRAVSLLLLKSIELHIQTAGRVERTNSAVEVYGYLQSLWGFLWRYSVQLREVTHLCCWVSLLFGEQDDDMMEAAKALFFIFLHHRQCSRLDDFTELQAACAIGCNPHCHFLLLLQSVSFDHSIILDFLISAETCFLEYFVRYLKYLRADWQSFTATCERVTMSNCQFSQKESLTLSFDAPALTCGPDEAEFSPDVQHTGATPQAERMSVVAGLRLVEYESSDESDLESLEICTEKPKESQCTVSAVNQETVKPPVFIRDKPTSTVAGGSEGFFLAASESRHRAHIDKAHQSGRGKCETSARAVSCLSQLREVVTRLQKKKLFPYNPSSLLKLLTEVENCSQQSPASQLNG